MSYMICDNSKNIYVNQIVGIVRLTTEISEATLWKTLKAATNMCKSLRNSKEFKEYNLKVKDVNKKVKRLDLLEDTDYTEYNIYDKLNEINEIFGQISKRQTYLLAKLQEIDLKISDIEHYAEMYELNAAKGYKVYKILHDARNERRTYKEELKVVEMMLRTLNLQSVGKVEKHIKELKNAKYRPRIYKELFA